MTYSKHNANYFQEWIRFRQLHPFNREPFMPNADNYKRWNRMNVNAMSVKASLENLPKITVDNSLILKIREIYRVTKFEEFPGSTQVMYNTIARCFPRAQVYACGSRVRGDYVDAYGVRSAERQVEIARAKAGLKHRRMSDYDFWVEPGAEMVGALPESADRCRLRIPENEKVAIPIYMP